MSFHTDLFTKNHGGWLQAYGGPSSQLEFLELRAQVLPVATSVSVATKTDDTWATVTLTGKVVTRVFCSVTGTGDVSVSIGDQQFVLGSTAAACGTAIDLTDVHLSITNVTAIDTSGTPKVLLWVAYYTPATD
jgi:hypothetical protein